MSKILPFEGASESFVNCYAEFMSGHSVRNKEWEPGLRISNNVSDELFSCRITDPNGRDWLGYVSDYFSRQQQAQEWELYVSSE